MKKTIQRIRHRENALPTYLTTLSELILFELYTITINIEPFILYDSGADDNNGTSLFSTEKKCKNISIRTMTLVYW